MKIKTKLGIYHRAASSVAVLDVYRKGDEPNTDDENNKIGKVESSITAEKNTKNIKKRAVVNDECVLATSSQPVKKTKAAANKRDEAATKHW